MIERNKREELLRTLAFFSFFSFPISLIEARLFSTGVSQEEVDEVFQAWEVEGIIDRLNGLYTLRGAKIAIAEQVAVRSSRYLDSMEKLRRARPYLRYLTLLPWIEGVALCNSIAWQFTKPESDTDLVLFVKPKYLFTARLFTVLPLMLFRLRPKAGRIHTIDTNFFVATDALNLRFLREEEDPYFDQWMRALLPVYESSTGLFARFFRVNAWSGARERTPLDTPVRFRFAHWYKLPVVVPERLAKMIQDRWFPKEIRETMNKGTAVVINDAILKFHKNDRRAEIARHVAFTTSLWSSSI